MPHPVPSTRIGLALAAVFFVGSGTARAETPTPQVGAGAPAAAPRLSEMSLEELLEVRVVAAAKHEQGVAEAPANVTVITARQIRQRGYASVGEALRSVAGVDVLDDHFLLNLGVRGINGGLRSASRVVKVMIDGQPVSFRPTAENFLGEEMIPIDAVERIEVVRGPASALYGADAFLGVINVVTKDPAKVEGALVSGKSGLVEDHLAYGGSALAAGTCCEVSSLAAVTGSHADRSGLRPRDLPGATTYAEGGRSHGDLANAGSAFAKASYGDPALGKFSLDGNFQLIDSFAEFADWGVLTHDNRLSLQNYYLRGRYDREVTPAVAAHVSAAYAGGSPTAWDRLATNETGLADFVTRIVGYDAFDGLGELDLTLADWASATLGVDASVADQRLLTYVAHRDGEAPEPTGNPQGNETFVDVGLYLQTELRPFAALSEGLLEDLALTLGVRFDHHDVYDDQLTYRAAGVYPLGRGFFVKAMLGTSFRAPAPSQLFSTLLVPGDVLANPALDPERAQTAEVGLGAQLLDGHLHLDLSGFLTRVEDKIELVRRPGNVSNVFAANLSDIDSAGLEAELRLDHDPIETYLNVSYEESILTKRDPLHGSFDVDTRLYPDVMVKGGINWAIEALHLNLNTEGRYVGRRIASDANTAQVDPIDLLRSYSLPDYFEMDATVSTLALRWIGKRETILSIKIENLFDQSYAYPGFADFDIPALGRQVWFRLSQEL